MFFSWKGCGVCVQASAYSFPAVVPDFVTEGGETSNCRASRKMVEAGTTAKHLQAP